tara:strand:+ start:4698 stop:5495 length:798 start_codon:yes stop_codon:yes gene_type:complete
MATTQVQEKKENLPINFMSELSEFAGEGLDSIGADDMQIPFLRIIQTTSPQLNKQESVYIKGASGGDLFNTVTGEVWDSEEGVYVIPCGYTLKYLEFQLRTEGGGFMGELKANDPVLTQTSRDGATELLPSGNELIRSAQHLVMIVDVNTGATQTAICDMKKTQLKVSKRWNTMMKMVQYTGPNGLFNPPMWGTIWKLTSIQESNDRGSWYNFAVEKVDPTLIPQEAFLAAKAFYQSFRSGEIKTQAVTNEEVINESSKDEELPF